MGKKNTKKKPLNKRKVLITLCVVLSIILAILIGVAVYAEYILGLINYRDPNETLSSLSESEYNQFLEDNEIDNPDFTGPNMNGSDVIWGEDANSIGQGADIVNILLVGQDRRKGETRARSDSMILCTINRVENTITLTSFLRDLYVQIPGYRDNRINVSYFLGGTDLLNECIEKNFGVHIDGNVEVDFSGFQKIIDILGGVDIELSSAEAAYLNRRGNWDVNNSSAGTWSLKEGLNHLTGEQALAYSRIRQVGYTGDFGRTDRQKTVLNALFEKAKKMNLSQVNSLLTNILPLISTDLTNKEIVSYVMQVFPMLRKIDGLGTYRVPADGAYQMTMIDGMSVLLPNLEASREMLEEIMKTE